MTRTLILSLIGLAILTAVSTTASAQEARYPITVIAPGKGPFSWGQSRDDDDPDSDEHAGVGRH